MRKSGTLNCKWASNIGFPASSFYFAVLLFQFKMMAVRDEIPDRLIPLGISWRDNHDGLNLLRAIV
ncbi:MAG: hypothetical protein ACE5NG_05645 [bacterium]